MKSFKVKVLPAMQYYKTDADEIRFGKTISITFLKATTATTYGDILEDATVLFTPETLAVLIKDLQTALKKVKVKKK